MTSQKVFIFLLQILLITLITKTTTTQSSEAPLNYAGGRCSYSETITTNSTYHTNILTVLSNLYSLSSANQFFLTSSGSGLDQVNGFYLCRPDLSLSTCHACINATIDTFRQFCFNRKETILWYQQCMIRYTNNSISASDNTTEPWFYNYSSLNVSDSENFPKIVNSTMQKLISQAVSLDHTPRFFAYGKANFTAFEEFNGMVFCRPDMTPEDCEVCLMTALGKMPICCADSLSLWTMVLLPNCQLRYDTAPFIFPS